MSETDISRTIKQALVDRGHRVIRIQAGSVAVGAYRLRFAEAGTPDLMVLTSFGTTVLLETKTEEGKLSDDQRRWHAWARGAGHRVEVVRSAREAVLKVEAAR